MPLLWLMRFLVPPRCPSCGSPYIAGFGTGNPEDRNDGEAGISRGKGTADGSGYSFKKEVMKRSCPQFAEGRAEHLSGNPDDRQGT